MTAATRRYAIDVMAGASAGSMTLALLAHELLYCQSFADPHASVFHQAWVERIDIDGLLLEDPRRGDTHPLSHRPVRDLGSATAASTATAPTTTSSPVPTTPSPAMGSAPSAASPTRSCGATTSTAVGRAPRSPSSGCSGSTRGPRGSHPTPSPPGTRALPGRCRRFRPDTTAALRTLFPEEDKRRMVRRRVEARVDAYSRHLKMPWLARLPAMSLVRNALDAQLYYDYRHHYVAAGWIPSIESVGRPFYQANLYTNLARVARWAQEDSRWPWWTLNYETYLGIGAGADSQLGNRYCDLSVRWHLYRRRVGWPVKVQPELGYRRSAAEEHGLDAGRYAAVGLAFGQGRQAP